MRRKVSTLLEESLFRRTRLESARQGRQISDIVGEALDRYLTQADGPGSLRVVAETWSVLRLKPALVKQVLLEEPDVLEA